MCPPVLVRALIRVTLCRGGPMCPPVLIEALIRVTLCRGGPMCPPVLVRALIRVTLCRGGPMCPPVLVRALIRVTLCFLSSYASKKRSFFSFRKFGRLLFGELLVGVGAPTVGADLCVRPSSPERSLFFGRTRRSAPTQTTSARQIQPSDAVTPVFVWTHGRASIVSKRDE